MKLLTRFALCLLLVAGLFEPVLAGNKFTTIGGGVAGSHDEKIEILKQISVIAGNFLILLAIIALLTRNRFEGFIGMYRKKSGEAVTRVPLIMILLGSLLIGLYFI